MYEEIPNTLHLGPSKYLTMVGYSDVFPKNNKIQANDVRITISLTTIVCPQIERSLFQRLLCVVD